MGLSIHQLVSDFAWALKKVDEDAPQGRSARREYQPGIGPLTEANAVQRAVDYLKGVKAHLYESASPMAYPGQRTKCDLVIPGQWAVEFKLVRPFGDNGKPAEDWSENLLHPYPGNISSIGDSLKLCASLFKERKAIVVFGYEHTPPQIQLEPAVRAFEVISKHVVGVVLSERHVAEAQGLIHPVHQQLRVYGWQVLDVVTPERSSTGH